MSLIKNRYELDNSQTRSSGSVGWRVWRIFDNKRGGFWVEYDNNNNPYHVSFRTKKAALKFLQENDND